MMESDQVVSKMDKGERVTKGELTRRKIVAAAAPIFNQRGYEGSSLADLMAATGLKKGGIYRHFSSKEELAAAAFDYTWQAAQDARLAHLDEKASAIEQLKQSIANFIHVRSPIAGGCPILNTAVEADDGNPILRARASDALRSWVARLQLMVKRAAKQGDIREGVDAKAVATFIVATLEGALMMSRLEHSDYALRQVQRYLDHYLDVELAPPAE